MRERKIVDVIVQHYPKVVAVYLFGSHATQQQSPDSDVDLALLLPHSPEKQGPLLRSACWDELTDLLEQPVDLIDLRSADTVFQNEILRTGRLLHSSDDGARLAFEGLTLSLYQKLQDERREIVESILESKRVYNV